MQPAQTEFSAVNYKKHNVVKTFYIMQLNCNILADAQGNVYVKHEHGYNKLHAAPETKYLVASKNKNCIGLTYDNDIYKVINNNFCQPITINHKVKSLLCVGNTFAVLLDNGHLCALDHEKLCLDRIMLQDIKEASVIIDIYIVNGSDMRCIPKYKGIFAINYEGQLYTIMDDYKNKTKLSYIKTHRRDVNMKTLYTLKSCSIVTNESTYRTCHSNFSKVKRLPTDNIIDVSPYCSDYYANYSYIDSYGRVLSESGEIQNKFLNNIKAKQFVLFDIEDHDVCVHFVDDNGDLYRMSKEHCISDVPLPFPLIYDPKFKHTKSTYM